MDTGAFITGSYSNGFLVSGDHQGLIGLPLLGIPVDPGYFTTGGPSSGFFNSGAGKRIGIQEPGAGLSGYPNTGALGSGVANVGTIQLVRTLDLATPGFLSGIGNFGTNLAGFLGITRKLCHPGQQSPLASEVERLCPIVDSEWKTDRLGARETYSSRPRAADRPPAPPGAFAGDPCRTKGRDAAKSATGRRYASRRIGGLVAGRRARQAGSSALTITPLFSVIEAGGRARRVKSTLHSLTWWADGGLRPVRSAGARGRRRRYTEGRALFFLLGSCVPLLTTTMRAGRANQSRVPVTKAK